MMGGRQEPRNRTVVICVKLDRWDSDHVARVARSRKRRFVDGGSKG